MSAVLKGLIRGAVAGAAGTTASNAVNYGDMAIRGRPANDTPVTMVATLADRFGVGIPGHNGQRDNRLHALAPLGGSLTGVAVGGLAGVLRSVGLRVPTAIGGPVLGALAMAATDVPAARLRLTDPRQWSGADWASDALPHLAYGLAAHATLVATSRDTREAGSTAHIDLPGHLRRSSRSRVLFRSALLGAATGARSAIGLLALAAGSKSLDRGPSGVLAHPVARATAGLLAVGEVVVDKDPRVPPRTSAQGLPPRLALAATGAHTLARRDGVGSVGPVIVAVAAAAATSFAGLHLRGLAARRCGLDLPGALLEDLLAAALAGIAARRG